MSPCPSEYHPSGEEDDSEEEFHQTHMSPYQTHPGLPHQLPYSEGHKHEETFYGSQRSAMNLIQGAHAIRAPSVYCAPEMEAEIASDEDDMLHAAQYLTPVSSLSPQLQHGTLGFTPILRHSYPQPAYANLQEYASYITQEDIAAAQAMIPDVSPSHSEQLFGQPMDLSVAPFIPSTASFSADYPCELVRSQSCHADEYADEDDSALEGTFQTIPYTMRRRHSIATACDPTLVPFLGFDHSALNNDDEMDVVTYV
ncbi:uncharacterized protein EV422DRAFT_165171 [Fimicolochytrium jonesii]|uniref:uncharacterized protein n=1 Tax=Fimicolochytrium jonesii TaxID=1396493 RepID=UPI0022FDF73F|nr:uncharacterized protein EV422DRAFT_165171 [Fimicolochytrium jonesii]KAI8818792.1 hypothetical protein EV422DRAFT_165171 [Fimicolochytrium jonesii]